MKDLQLERDQRGVPLQTVGIKNFCRPCKVNPGDGEQQTAISFDLSTDLAPHRRGTHMSRLVAAALEPEQLNARSMQILTRQLAQALDAQNAGAKARCRVFITKTAPATGLQSPMPLDLTWEAFYRENQTDCRLTVTSEAQTLCPCSKAISNGGAHNQRAEVNVTFRPADALTPIEVSEMVDKLASSPLYALLKRPDEKVVTERGYANPKFVEDLARDLIIELRQVNGLCAARVEIQSAESIHRHDAFAVASFGRLD